jgi:hypothetical protein
MDFVATQLVDMQTMSIITMLAACASAGNDGKFAKQEITEIPKERKHMPSAVNALIILTMDLVDFKNSKI